MHIQASQVTMQSTRQYESLTIFSKEVTDLSPKHLSDEEENTYFDTTGTVVTADGKEISFQLSLTMSRSFTEAYTKKYDFRPPEYIDPLVIHLDQNISGISDQKFYFDLDADGHAEAISNLSGNSGFLALDKNQDGSINDGTELFGAQSGNGFEELAAYDEDGNGWIDEADSIFQSLLIYTKDATGKDILCGLGAARVGAICLAASPTDFSLVSNQTHETNARIRQSGIFLYENEDVGSVQQFDFAR